MAFLGISVELKEANVAFILDKQAFMLLMFTDFNQIGEVSSIAAFCCAFYYSLESIAFAEMIFSKFILEYIFAVSAIEPRPV